jgi:hypothetical protein
MKLPGASGQSVPHFTYDASGTIASSTVPQLILPRSLSRSHFVVANLSPTLPMYLEMGSARAVATLTGGVVTSVAVTNAGFGFSRAPLISFRGGGAGMFPGFLGSNDPNSPSPSKPATAHCVMSGSAPNQIVASVTVDFGGSGYLVAPYVLILNDALDANGCADPSAGGFSGLPILQNGGNYYVNGTACGCDQMALYCPTGAGAKFTVKWMD